METLWVVDYIITNIENKSILKFEINGNDIEYRL